MRLANVAISPNLKKILDPWTSIDMVPPVEPTDFVTDPQYELDFHQKIFREDKLLKERFVKIKCQVQLY